MTGGCAAAAMRPLAELQCTLLVVCVLDDTGQRVLRHIVAADLCLPAPREVEPTSPSHRGGAVQLSPCTRRHY